MFSGRVVGDGDPAWLTTDREYALAWQANKRATCSACGTRADEWDDDEDAYISSHLMCEGCARLADERTSNLDKGPDGAFLAGQHAFLVPREVHEQQRPRTAAPDDD